MKKQDATPEGYSVDETTHRYYSAQAEALLSSAVEERPVYVDILGDLLEDDAPILDVGAGLGRDVHLLSKEGFGIRGIDPNEELIARAREAYDRVLTASGFLESAWSGAEIRNFLVDHAMPFALWGRNDLWNLLPAAPKVNTAERARLPGRALVEHRQGSGVRRIVSQNVGLKRWPPASAHSYAMVSKTPECRR
jgi:SAM-dependent methyltransferase